MYLFKLISLSKYLKNYIYLFLMFFCLNNLLVAKADVSTNTIISSQEENKLSELYSHDGITYSQHDKLNSQLKMFFGFDIENLETSFYKDFSLIVDSDTVRDMYKLKLNDMTIEK